MTRMPECGSSFRPSSTDKLPWTRGPWAVVNIDRFFFFLKPLYFKLIRRGTGLRRRVRCKLFRGMEVASTSSLVRGRPPARTAAVAPRLGTHSLTVSESGPESMVYPTRSQGGRGCNNWY